MQAVVIERPGRFRIKDLPPPRPEKGEVAVDVRACCVCGTDIHLLDGEFKGAAYPLIPGHEFSGVVSEIGPVLLNNLEAQTDHPDVCQTGSDKQAGHAPRVVGMASVDLQRSCRKSSGFARVG